MFKLQKRTIAKYLRSECKRQLRLMLYESQKPSERENTPPKDPGRPGLLYIAEQGRQFERAKYRELKNSFPAAFIAGPEKPFQEGEDTAYKEMRLKDALLRPEGCPPNAFLIEAEFEADTPAFIAANALQAFVDGTAFAGTTARLVMGRLRPDIIALQPPDGTARAAITPDGQVVPIGPEDRRIGMKIIDVKITSEPSPTHFAELAFYAMALSSWLEHHGLNDQYFVLKNAAIWPGKHEASALLLAENDAVKRGLNSASDEALRAALLDDLEELPAEVVIGRLKEFFAEDLPGALLTSDWRSLPWHVDRGCRDCDYLGYQWKPHLEGEEDKSGTRADMCWNEAVRTDHLCRINGLTRGACGCLVEQQAATVSEIAQRTPQNKAFDSHQKLREMRVVLQSRAKTLIEGADTSIPERSGSTAILPKFQHFSITMSADFDIGSGLTFALGVAISALLPTSLEIDTNAAGRSVAKFKFEAERDDSLTSVLLVETKSLLAEQRIVGQFFSDLVTKIESLKTAFHDRARALVDENASILDRHNVPQKDRDKLRNTEPTCQFFLWDRLTFEHFKRLTGRHFIALANQMTGSGHLSPVPWLFPAEHVIDDADFSGATGPVTILKEAIDTLVAANIPFNYGLYTLANSYYVQNDTISAHRPPGNLRFPLNWRFHDPLSDQIPSERGHEIWNNKSAFKSMNFQDYRTYVRNVVRNRLRMVQSVTRRLSQDLRPSLTANAPQVKAILEPPKALSSVAKDLQVIYQHANMLYATEELDVDTLMAMPPYVREAKFESIRLTRKLDGEDRLKALRALNLDGHADPHLWVFEVSERSTDAKVKVGDFNLSLLSEAGLPFAAATVAAMKLHHGFFGGRATFDDKEWRQNFREACGVTICAFDRENCLIAVQVKDLLLSVANEPRLDFSLDAATGSCGIIDPVSRDFFVRWRLRPAIEAIRVPPLSVSQPLISDQPARVKQANPRQTASVPCDRFIWDAKTLADEASGRNVALGMASVETHAAHLTEAQKAAIRTAISKRLSLIWGPPGSGKSATAAELIRALVNEALSGGKAIRIAITGPTWVAIDTVASKIAPMLNGPEWRDAVSLNRLQSQATETDIPEALKPFVLSSNASLSALQARLEEANAVSIVAGTVNQIGRLWAARSDAGDEQEGPQKPSRKADLKELFDFILIDEASQMTLAQSVVAFATLASGASVAVVGDQLQMPPVQSVPPPEKYEHIVGSIYDFYYRYRTGKNGEITPVLLDRSFRSNSEIVSFVRQSGYGGEFVPHEGVANRRLGLLSPFSAQRPTDWPLDNGLWGPHLAQILDPAKPLVAVVHDDLYSSQRNEEEIGLVAALVASLVGKLGAQDGTAAAQEPLSIESLFKSEIGIVTPHRAQQAGVLDRLKVLARSREEHESLRAAIDTVERFQGQERSVIIATFGLGDRDQIASEEEFLYSLNRFNVIASRAKSKLIVITSEQLVRHLPSDPDVLRGSWLLKHFCSGYLPSRETISVSGFRKVTLRT